MELCIDCHKPESEHVRRVFGHRFRAPEPQNQTNPEYASDLVDSLSSQETANRPDDPVGPQANPEEHTGPE